MTIPSLPAAIEALTTDIVALSQSWRAVRRVGGLSEEEARDAAIRAIVEATGRLLLEAPECRGGHVEGS